MISRSIKKIKRFYEERYNKVVQQFSAEKTTTPDNARSFKKSLKHIPDYYIIRHGSHSSVSLVLRLLWVKHGRMQITAKENCELKIKSAPFGSVKMSMLPLYVHFMDIKNDVLTIEGAISYPGMIQRLCVFFAELNGEIAEPEWNNTTINQNIGNNIFEECHTFKVKFQLKDRAEICFFNAVNDIKSRCKNITFMRFSPVSNCIDNQYCVLDRWIVYVSDNKICCRLAENAEIANREKAFEKSLQIYDPKKAEWAVKLRENYFNDLRKKEKPIWLFMDRPERADDNARELFCYVQQYKNIESYFIISEDSKDYEEMRKIGKTVALYSEKHFRLTFLADYMISSQANGIVENPFWADAEMFRDLYHKPKLVFLQHGVIKDNMSATLNRFHTNFFAFITSTEDEQRSIIEYPYNYSEKEVWLTGLPRFDKLYNEPKRYILIMPSWRKEIMKQQWDESKQNMIWQPTENYKESEFFKSYGSLLKNDKLKKLCSEYGYRLVFMAHPLMKKYMEQFTDIGECELWDDNVSYRKAFAEGSILITDYSSVAFDFAYLEKPVLYYQFDKERFFANHTYEKGYFDYEKNGFGEVCISEDELVEAIGSYMKNGMTVKDIYLRRMKETFRYHDRNNCKRIYELLMKG